MVPRPTKGSADLTRREIKEGSAVLLEKLQTFRPKVAVFNGKLIYEVFSGKKDFCFGKQPDTIAGTNTVSFVLVVCVDATFLFVNNSPTLWGRLGVAMRTLPPISRHGIEFLSIIILKRLPLPGNRSE